ncbi:MAG: PD-(D/E)XK nuclease family protein, partial [Rhodococcus sp. (in: high G+C Gram-positive bacteria)]
MMGDAYARLAEAVDRAKHGSPLAAVTVVVPNFGVARDVILHLARTVGVANTSVLTVDQVVTRLAAPVLAPRVALPYPLLEGAVQRVLAEAPGVFSEVADQPITAQALAHASQQLAARTVIDLEDPTPLVAEVIRIHHNATTAHSDRYFLPHEAYAAARARMHTLGRVIVFLPCELDPAHGEFLAQLQQAATTVDDGAEASGTAEATGTLVIHASDADDEVRAVTRLVRSHLAAGVPGHRIGVFYGSVDPYLPLLHEHFTQAAIGFHGPESRGFADRAAARTLLRLLQLDTDIVPRRELLAILAERAVQWQDEDGATLSGRQAELLTRRDLPIVGGDDWGKLDTLDPGHRRYGTALLLRRFVESLRRDLRGVAGASTWPEVSATVMHLVDRYFRTDPRQPADTVLLRDIAAGLAELDGIAATPTPQGIVDAVTVRVERQRMSAGAAGASVTIGPIPAGSGRNLDVCVVVGMAEGIVPAIRREDPLLPDAVTGVTPALRLEFQHRQLQMTIAAGRCHRVLTFPRGSLRGGAEKVPSRWLLPTLNALTGAAVSTTGWRRDTERCDRVVTIESFDAATQHCDERVGVGAASATEWRLRALAAAPARQRRHRLPDPVIARGMEMRGDR